MTCSGHGTCSNSGVCICDKYMNCNLVINRYGGEFCSVACDYLTDCNGHGVCSE